MSFWLNIAKSGVYLRYRHCFKLFRELRKESEFRQWCCQNSTKVWERKRKSGREKILNFGNHVIEILAAQTGWPSGVWSVKCPKRNQLWQCHCRNRGVKKKFWNCEKWNGIRQCHCHNSIPPFFFFFFFKKW